MTARAGARLVDVVEQPAVAVGADHQIDVRRAPPDLVLQVFGHAAGDAQHHVGARLAVREHAGAREHPLLRLLAHRAGVDQDQIGRRRIVRARVAAAIEQPQHQIAVGDVHLAAVRLEIDLSRRLGDGGR